MGTRENSAFPVIVPSTFFASNPATALAASVALPATGSHFTTGPLYLSTNGVTGSTPVLYFGDAGVGGTSYLGYWKGNNEVFFNIVAPDAIWTVDIAGIGCLRVGAQGIQMIGGENTLGRGAPAIVAYNAALGLNSTQSNFLSYTPATAAMVEIAIEVNVRSWVTPASFTIQLAYTDDSGNVLTETLALNRGSTGAAATAITAVDRWYAPPVLIRAAGGVTINVSIVGTFTGSPLFNASGTIARLV